MAAKSLGRWRSTDMIGGRAVPIRAHDQGGEEEELGQLLCWLTEGRDGNYTGHDAKGRVLRIRRAKDGALEIRHLGETGVDEADPNNIVGSYPGIENYPRESTDPSRAAGRTGDAYSRFLCTGKWEYQGAALRAYQKRLDAFYGNK